MKTKNIILGAILAIIGIIMIAIPDACIKAVVVLVGLAAVAFSVYNLLVVYKNTEDSAFKKTLLIKSICTFVIGLISIVCPFALVKTVATIWKIISVVLAVYLILYAGVSVYSSAKLRATYSEESKKLLFEALIIVAIAILLIFIPFSSFVKFVGFGGLIVGLVMVAVEIVVGKRTAVAEEEDISQKMDPQTAAETQTASDSDSDSDDD